MIETIEYKGSIYPLLQSQGFAAQYAFAFADKFCVGRGVDIGCMKEEWAYPGAVPVDPEINKYDAMYLPPLRIINSIRMTEASITDVGYGIGGDVTYRDDKWDYIFSSHCLEHIPIKVSIVLEYWLTQIKKGGIIFLYLPNCDYQTYWAFGNRKHVHYLNPAIMKGVCEDLNASKYFVTEGYDLNGSFYCVIER